jgi:hypothetical protein
LLLEFEPTIIAKEEIKNRLEKSGYKFVRLAGARHKILDVNFTIPINFILGAGRRLVGYCLWLL